MGYLLLEEDLFVKHRIIEPRSPAGQRIHSFLLARAKLLAGKKIDFENNPVAFVMSDDEYPNAFYAQSSREDSPPKRDEYKNVKYTKNPLDIPVIGVTKGLIKLVDNLDQLDHVLAHELTHMIIGRYGRKSNSKGEESLSDLHGVDLVYDAGSDPKQALILQDKLYAYSQQHKEEIERRERRHRSDEENTGVNWSEILDVHVTHSNSRTMLEASLTRLSHLIDQRVPTVIDKSIFAADFNDPITGFLKANDYENQNTVGKLKVLIDCVDHLSTRVPAADFYQTQLELLAKREAEADPKDWGVSYEIERAREEIQEKIAKGYKNYFTGSTIEKKYQQETASLAEGLFEELRGKEDDDEKPSQQDAINLDDTIVYLQDKAYQHIKNNGYPKVGNSNYFDASGIIYTYFYTLLKRHDIPYSEENNLDVKPPKILPQMAIDLEDATRRIRNARELSEFVPAAEEFKEITRIREDLTSISYGEGSRINKFENLSFIDTWGTRHTHFERLYQALEVGQSVPWNNLAEIAKSNADATPAIVSFLKEQNIEDYRITHGLPFVRTGWNDVHVINDEGLVVKKGERYELEYAIQTDLVIRSYEHIKNYFENETALFDRTCDTVLGITDADFRNRVDANGFPTDDIIASKKILSFVELYNSLPHDDSDNNNHRRWGESDSVFSFISGQFLKENPSPCADKKGKLTLDKALFEFDNPIFQKHFGEDFKEQLTNGRSARKERMFDTALEVIKAAADMWASAFPKLKELSEEEDKLRQQGIALEYHDPLATELRHELEILHEEKDHYHTKVNAIENIVHYLTQGIISTEKHWYQLDRLTTKQKEILADYIIKDEKGTLNQLLGSSIYDSFCDFRDVLTHQIKKVISGDYTPTEMMQTIADNLGYQKADTQEALADFHAHYEEREHVSRRERPSRYVRHLHVFDTMRYLENSAEVDLRALAKAIANISVSDYDPYSKRIAADAYKNYVEFVRESHLPQLVSKAVNFQKNYEGLSVDDLIETADGLISVRNQLAKVLVRKESSGYDCDEHGYASEKYQDVTKHEHRKALDTLDSNIRDAIRKAQQQVLQKTDQLEQITDLFRLHNPYNGNPSSDNKRAEYLEATIRENKSLENLSAISENKAFWPQDVEAHIKAYVFAKNTFLDDVAFEDKLLNKILDKLEMLPSGEKKKNCFSVLLDRNLRAPYPETRDRLFGLYANDVAGQLGKDDASGEYKEKLTVILKDLENTAKKDWDIGKQHGRHSGLLSNSLSAADKYILLRQVSDRIVSQEETSSLLKKFCQVNLKSDDLVRSYLYGVGVDYLTAEMDRDPNSAKKFIQFLNSKGESQDCSAMSAYIAETLADEDHKGIPRHGKKTILANTKPINCKLLYENFWSAPLEARAVITARILKCAINGNSGNEKKSQQSWERIFDVVMDNIISPDDTSVESKFARDVMHSYIKARSDYEREIILSAMMVVNRNIGADAGNVGKALKLFMENMGPAEIKLGQAIASHPDTPERIRKELQDLKNRADIPPRWVLYEWIRAENIPQELWKNKYLGEVRGSASYYTTIDLAESDVFRILRPEAREKATKGFRVIGDTVVDLDRKNATSDLGYDGFTTSVSEMVTQAARMSAIETNLEIGQKQCEYAQEIYNGVQISNGRETFSLRVMNWKARGHNWVIMQKAEGPVFNDLPENTPEQIAYKKDFAKAYIVFEMRRILSGGKFDHDRHGAQLCVDRKTNEAGIYDSGAMALRDPTVEEQRQLGRVVYDALESVIFKRHKTGAMHQMDALGAILSDRVKELHKENIDTQYLVEVRKGLLALGDFFRVLDTEDVRDLISEIDIHSHMSEHAKSGMFDKMSRPQKAILRLTLANNPLAKRRDSIVITQTRLETVNSVTNFDVAPDVPRKSDWLEQVLVPDPLEDASKHGSRRRDKVRLTRASRTGLVPA